MPAGQNVLLHLLCPQMLSYFPHFRHLSLKATWTSAQVATRPQQGKPSRQRQQSYNQPFWGLQVGGRREDVSERAFSGQREVK